MSLWKALLYQTAFYLESNRSPSRCLTPTAAARQPRVGETEKMAVNMGVVDLGQDLLVQEAFYSDRSNLRCGTATPIPSA